MGTPVARIAPAAADQRGSASRAAARRSIVRSWQCQGAGAMRQLEKHPLQRRAFDRRQRARRSLCRPCPAGCPANDGFAAGSPSSCPIPARLPMRSITFISLVAPVAASVLKRVGHRGPHGGWISIAACAMISIVVSKIAFAVAERRMTRCLQRRKRRCQLGRRCVG